MKLAASLLITASVALVAGVACFSPRAGLLAAGLLLALWGGLLLPLREGPGK